MKLIDPPAKPKEVKPPPEEAKPSIVEKVIVYVLSGAIILAVIGLLEAWPK